MDFRLLSEENRLTWLAFFADMVLHLNRECITLQSQLDEYRSTATTNLRNEEKLEFVKNVSPMIKKAMFNIFCRIQTPESHR
jgi:hypothetical protein